MKNTRRTTFVIIRSFFIIYMGMGNHTDASDHPQTIDTLVGGKRPPVSSFANDDCTAKILKSANIYDEGRSLEKQGDYDAAIRKFQEAVQESYPSIPMACGRYDSSGMARGGIERIYQKQGKFELALKELQWHLERNPEKYQDEKLELEALIKARDTKSTQPIYEHIEYLKKKYKDQLPPNAGAYSDTIASVVIRLYDHIGDYDQGIKFVEEFLRMCASGKTCSPDFEKYAYTIQNPYFQVKQAFEADKKTSSKGRATQALMQSNYFPW